LKATSSAADTPLRARSATRALERTETFIPMKPAEPENVPPIRKPIATWMPLEPWASSATASTTASTAATAPMIVYCRFRYALAPSWTAREIDCISSLPGGSDRSHREVSTP
jgi:hypothetical protein